MEPEAVECSSIMNHHLPIHLILYAPLITRVLRGGQDNSRNTLICTVAVTEDTGTSLNPTQ